MEFFDSHAHYNDERFEGDMEEIFNKIYKFGVTRIINSGYSVNSSEFSVKLTKKYDWIYATCGISPNDIIDEEDVIKKQLAEIEELAKNNKVVAIGEIGLDYYWNKENKGEQKELFVKQINIANKLNLPIVIHTREAIMDTIQILKEKTVNQKGVFHCCPLNSELIKEALNLGFYISLAGPITFKNSKNAESIIDIIPLEKTLIETDSPYLSPEPNRGKRNDSRNLQYMAKKIAEIKNVDIKEVAKITYENTNRIFKLN